MKPRRVVVELEMETDLPIAALRNVRRMLVEGKDRIPQWIYHVDDEAVSLCGNIIVERARVNVIRTKAPRRNKAKRSSVKFASPHGFDDLDR
ncbi:MAG: hypothetical protein WAT39_03220 [Planctomycetota bacterium]